MKTRHYSGTGVRENGFAEMHYTSGKLLNPLHAYQKYLRRSNKVNTNWYTMAAILFLPF
jgi:hypothetical protein